MPQKKTTRLLLAACFVASLGTVGCYSSQQLVQPAVAQKVSSNPAFLDNVLLASSSNNLAITTKSISTANLAYNTPGIHHSSPVSALQQKYAEMLEVMPQLLKNTSLYKAVDDWYGTRYRYGGTTKDGIDCSAFVMQVYSSAFGLDVLRTAAAQFTSACKTISDKAELVEGDLVFFKIKSRNISHVGIYLMNKYFVHASSSKGVMISSLDDSYWSRYYAGAGRIL